MNEYERVHRGISNTLDSAFPSLVAYTTTIPLAQQVSLVPVQLRPRGALRRKQWPRPVTAAAAVGRAPAHPPCRGGRLVLQWVARTPEHRSAGIRGGGVYRGRGVSPHRLLGSHVFSIDR